MTKISIKSARRIISAATLGVVLTVTTASAQYTAYWFDGFDVSTPTSDINFQIGAPRQGGSLIPTTYVANTANPANDYHHQMGFGPLILAGDGGVGLPYPDPSVGIVMVSPNANFSGLGGGGIVGRRITFSLDGFSNAGGSGYTTAGINIGGNSALTLAGSAAAHFGVQFVEDWTGATPNFFLQFFDGATLVQNSVVNPAGGGWANVQLDVNDLVDGNPWDGIGSTTIDVFVNSSLIYSYTKGSGGYLNNYMTLQGSANLAGFGLATHLFDNLTVFSAAPVPEPSTFALAGLGLVSLLVFRRRKV